MTLKNLRELYHDCEMAAPRNGRKTLFSGFFSPVRAFRRHLNGRFPTGVPAAQQHFYGKRVYRT
jgi:hypothetical protein